MRRVLLLPLVLLAVAAAPAAADEPRFAQLFLPSELRAAHPATRPSRIYHGVAHSLDTARMTYDLARGRGVAPDVAGFLAEVALLHDWDPRRAPDTPARVPATLEALAEDFAGTRPLIKGYQGTSVLRERFGWSRREVAVARAIILRTTFPFDDAAARTYERALRRLGPADRRLVLREAPLLSEYADKMSTYAMRDTARVRRATRGLAHEINHASGHRVTTARALDPAVFMAGLGAAEHFDHDRAIARRLGIRASYPHRATVFAHLPARYGATFDTNLAAARMPPPKVSSRPRASRPPRSGRGTSRPMRLRATTRFARHKAARR